MESLQEIINPTTQMLGDFMDAGYLNQFVNRSKQRFSEEEEGSIDGKDPNFFTTQSLETKISFLQLLQSVESQKKTSMENQIQAMEQLESCITTHDLDLSETQKSPLINRDKRKRKRLIKTSRNKEEVENQRMTHIAVERNRRRQMNDHLSSLRSLMPPSYVHRGDQASIVGGAIDFVKELEQHLQSLQASKRLKTIYESPNNDSSSPPYPLTPCSPDDRGKNDRHKAEIRSDVADIEVIVIQTHVNLKIQCVGRHGQLLKLIVAFDDLRFTVLHLSITSFESSVLFSFNLKIEEDCKIESADKIAKSVHQILNYINNGY